MSRNLIKVLLFLCPLAVFAQVAGSIAGTVVDASGSVVSGATLNLTNEATSALLTEKSDAKGDFVFTTVLPAIYTISAEMPGFKKFEKQHVELTPGDHISVGTLPLSIGDVGQSIVVQAEGATLQTENGERSGIVTSEEIQDLTVLNRDFTSFAELQPGVVMNVGAAVQTFSGNNQFNVLGGRATSNSFMVDGLTTSNTNQGNMNTTISLDNTQTVEVKVSNYSAETGRNSGFAVLAVSKSGGLHFHGAGYYYIRNEALNANSFFNNRNGIAQTPNRVSTLGGLLSGPLNIPHLNATRNKLFFVISAEHITELRPKGQVNVTVPTALERAGDFSQSGSNAKPQAAGGAPVTIKDPATQVAFPGNVIPASRILPSMQNYLKLLPLPNFVTPADLVTSKGAYNYIYQESLKVPKYLDSAKLDYNLSGNTTMFARFNYWWEDQQGSAVSASNTSWGWLDSHYTAITPSGVLSMTHIFSPTLVFQGSIGFSQFSEAGPPLSQTDMTAHTRQTAGFTIPQLFPGSNPYNLVPAATFGVSDSANPSYAARFPLQGVEDTYTGNFGATKVAGSHTFKVGLQPEHWLAMKGKNAASFAGLMTFSQQATTTNPLDTGYAYSNALLGVVYQYTEASNRFPMYELNTVAEWYLQDSWKVSRRLSIDWGLRWGWGTPWHNNQGLEAGFVPTTWNPSQAVKLIQPTLVNGVRMGLDPYSGAVLPALTIGAVAPEAQNPLNGIVSRTTNPSYPEGLRYGSGIKTAPRLNLAWDPFGKGKTVLRTGGGVFYDFHEIDNYGYAFGYSTPPLQYSPTIYNSYLTQLQQAQGYNFPNNIVGMNVNRPMQKTYNFSAGVQQDLGWGMILDTAYVGALGRHLMEAENLNSTPLGTNWLPSSRDASNKNAVLPSQFLRPYPGYGNITYYFYGGNSNYHSLQTTLRRRYKNNLTYGVIWTWSKAMNYSDTGTSSSTTQVSSLIDPKIWNYGEAGYDHTHIFRVYWNYNLPRASSLVSSQPFASKIVRAMFDNWQFSGFYTAQSGAPLGVSIGYSPSQDVTGSTDSGRPLVVANPVLPADKRGINEAFNTAAFAPPPYAACEVPNPPSICWGNAARSTFRGPGINDFDMSLFKKVLFLDGKLAAQLQVQAYNVFNHTQFTTVDTSATFNAAGVQTNGLFGQYTASNNSRTMNLALRFTF